MNKQKFIELVENPASICPKDTNILSDLAANYPYCSLIRSMLAKARQGSPEAKESLATAALYIPDRKVLKGIMENNLTKPSARLKTATIEASEHKKPQQTNISVQKISKKSPISTLGDEDEQELQPMASAPVPTNVVDELQENLRLLREQRLRFEEQNTEKDSKPEEPEEETKKEPTNNNIIPAHLPERLQEIMKTHRELQINDPKRMEQINLINSFIRNSSSISRRYRTLGDEKELPGELMANPYSTPQDLVTENLAQIMVRQGKTEKAIDIYEKLVLKYPQKSAYFATCIENLKNSL